MALAMALQALPTAPVLHHMDLRTLEWVDPLTAEDTDRWVDTDPWEGWDLTAGWDRMVAWEVMARWVEWEDTEEDMEEWEAWVWEEATVNLE